MVKGWKFNPETKIFDSAVCVMKFHFFGGDGSVVAGDVWFRAASASGADSVSDFAVESAFLWGCQRCHSGVEYGIGGARAVAAARAQWFSYQHGLLEGLVTSLLPARES